MGKSRGKGGVQGNREERRSWWDWLQRAAAAQATKQNRLEGQLAAVGNDDLLGRLARLAADGLDGLDHIHALRHAAKDHVAAWGWGGGGEVREGEVGMGGCLVILKPLASTYRRARRW